MDCLNYSLSGISTNSTHARVVRNLQLKYCQLATLYKNFVITDALIIERTTLVADSVASERTALELIYNNILTTEEEKLQLEPPLTLLKVKGDISEFLITHSLVISDILNGQIPPVADAEVVADSEVVDLIVTEVTMDADPDIFDSTDPIVFPTG